MGWAVGRGGGFVSAALNEGSPALPTGAARGWCWTAEPRTPQPSRCTTGTSCSKVWGGCGAAMGGGLWGSPPLLTRSPRRDREVAIGRGFHLHAVQGAVPGDEHRHRAALYDRCQGVGHAPGPSGSLSESTKAAGPAHLGGGERFGHAPYPPSPKPLEAAPVRLGQAASRPRPPPSSLLARHM